MAVAKRLSCQEWDSNPRLQGRLRPERSALDRSAILTAAVGASPLARLRRRANAGALGRSARLLDGLAAARPTDGRTDGRRARRLGAERHQGRPTRRGARPTPPRTVPRAPPAAAPASVLTSALAPTNASSSSQTFSARSIPFLSPGAFAAVEGSGRRARGASVSPGPGPGARLRGRRGWRWAGRALSPSMQRAGGRKRRRRRRRSGRGVQRRRRESVLHPGRPPPSSLV